MITSQRKLNIARSLLNKNLINFEEYSEFRIKDLEDMNDILNYINNKYNISPKLLDKTFSE